MVLCLVDRPEARAAFLPLTHTRPVADLRVGILTLAEKWAFALKPDRTTFQCDALFAHRYAQPPKGEPVLFIESRLLPASFLVEAVMALKPGEGLKWNDEAIAVHDTSWVASTTVWKELPGAPPRIERLWDLLDHNPGEIAEDIERLDPPVGFLRDIHTAIYSPEKVYVDPTADVRGAVLDASAGPIYIGPKAVIQPGSMIQGPVAILEGATVNMGGKIRAGTTIGPYCKVGGEVSVSILWGYSNKAHDGFLGHALLGQWCNLGAGTDCSNLKNDYGQISAWSEAQGEYVPTGRQFLGLTMGDHSKAGIGTMFNTATVVGVSANLFGAGFPPKFVPSFSWGGAEGLVEFRLEKALEVAEHVMARRQVALSKEEKALLTDVFQRTAAQRGA